MKRPVPGLSAGFFLVMAVLMATETPAQTPPATTESPTPENAKKFTGEAEQTLLKLWIDAGRADWVKSTFITDDTEFLAAQANEKALSAGVGFA